MEEVYLYIEKVEASKDTEGYWVNRVVTFTIRTETQEFSVPIKLASDTPDDDLLPKARAKLHQILQGALEKTKAWGPHE